MNDVFVSYSRKDREFVKKLVDALQGRGWAVWWDPTIRPGQYYEDVIEGALTTAKCVIVVWSKNSVASKWVRAEAGEAANRGVLVPVVIDNAKIPFRFKQIQEANLTDWQFTSDHPGLISLLDSIAATLSQNQPPPVTPPISPIQDEDEERPPAAALITHPGAIDDLRHYPARTVSPRSSISETQQPGFAATQPDLRRSSKTMALIAAAVVAVALVAGAIYLFASRRTANPDGGNQQARANNSPERTQTPSASPTATASPSASPSPARLTAAQIEKFQAVLTGQWQNQNTSPSGPCECSSSGCLAIEFGKVVKDFCIESNQLLGNAFYKLDSSRPLAYLFLREVTEGGRGGVQLERIDRRKPLAEIDYSDVEKQGVIYVTWNGVTESGGATRGRRPIGSAYQGTYSKR